MTGPTASPSDRNAAGKRAEWEKLRRFRGDVHSVDSELVRILARRMRLARKIGFLKWKLGMGVIDPVAERRAIGNVVRTATKSGLDAGYAKRIAALIIECSVETQMRSRPPPIAESGRRVAILGAGGMGAWLARFFRSRGDHVVLSDRDPRKARHLAARIHAKYAASNAEAALGSDIVVLATPVCAVSSVVKEILPTLGSNALLVDICAVKSAVVPTLRLAERQGVKVASIHPMFGPHASGFRNRVIIAVRSGRPQQILSTINDLFPGAHVMLTDANVHDKHTAMTLALPHFLNMAFASTICNRKNLPELRKFAGRTFKLQMLLAETVASEPETTADIQLMNKQFGLVLREVQREIGSLATIVSRRDRTMLVARYRRIRELLSADSEFDLAQRTFESVCETASMISRS